MGSGGSSVSCEHAFGRLVLVLVAIVIGAIAVIELAVVSNIEFTRALIRETMLVGSLLWAFVTIRVVYVDSRNANNDPFLWRLVRTALFIVVATISVVGMYVSSFNTFALWANAGLAVLFIVVLLMRFPQGWRSVPILM